MAPIAFLTDFGSCDWFAGSMKAAIAAVDPQATVIDITHDVKPGDVRGAAFVLRACAADFPAGTVFAAVVDPGVGGSRAALAARAGDYFFVGPDNGVLSFALDKCGAAAVHAIREPRFMRPKVCATFHGRDIFAPAAAHISMGIALEQLGPALRQWVRLAWPSAVCEGERIIGEIVYIDRFGNAITSIEAALIGDMRGRKNHVRCPSAPPVPLAAFYGQVAEGEPVAVPGSSGQLEVSVNRGNAALRFGLEIGDRVEVVPDSAA